MTNEEYESYVDLFASDGWKMFIDNVEEVVTVMKEGAVDNAPTNETWQFLRGQITQMNNILGFESYIKLSYEQGENDASDSV